MAHLVGDHSIGEFAHASNNKFNTLGRARFCLDTDPRSKVFNELAKPHMLCYATVLNC